MVVPVRQCEPVPHTPASQTQAVNMNAPVAIRTHCLSGQGQPATLVSQSNPRRYRGFNLWPPVVAIAG